MSDYDEPTIRRDTIFTGKLIEVYVDHVRLPDGNIATRELVTHPGAVAVLPLTDDNRLVVVEQYRKALEKVTVELPAGKLEKGEEPLACAKRELKEETGYVASRWTHLVSFYTSPGFADEYIRLFVAKGLEQHQARPDEDEFVQAREITLDEAFSLIASADICDAKTVTAIYAWQSWERANE